MNTRAAVPVRATACENGPVDTAELRRALGAFATGVTIVTGRDGNGRPRGFTVNSFTSVSLDPPLVLVCISKRAGSREVFETASSFAVNILSESQKPVSIAFASGVRDRFRDVEWRGEATGAPILEHVASWLDCLPHERIDAGDHFILIGRVVAFGHSGARPLGYCRGAYISFGVMDDAVEPPANFETLGFGAVIERQGAIFLVRDPQSDALGPPTARHRGPAEREGSLGQRLDALGIKAELSFPLAVIDEPSQPTHTIYYRGEATAVSADADRSFYPFDAIPWRDIASENVRSMLQHFVHEREQDAFLL